MKADRIFTALLGVGIAIADVGAIEFFRPGGPKLFGFVLAGLAAATVGGLGLLLTRCALRKKQIKRQADH